MFMERQISQVTFLSAFADYVHQQRQAINGKWMAAQGTRFEVTLPRSAEGAATLPPVALPAPEKLAA